MTTARKQIFIPQSEAAKMREFATLNGGSVSSLGREWIESFLERGSDYAVEPDPGTKVEILVDRDLLARAEEKAREEYGATITEILRFEIGQIDKLL